MNMGSANRSDMQISYIQCVRKTIKQYKKLFFLLLDVHVLNSFILYKQKSRDNIQLYEVRLELIGQITEMYGKRKITRPLQVVFEIIVL